MNKSKSRGKEGLLHKAEGQDKAETESKGSRKKDKAESESKGSKKKDKADRKDKAKKKEPKKYAKRSAKKEGVSRTRSHRGAKGGKGAGDGKDAERLESGSGRDSGSSNTSRKTAGSGYTSRTGKAAGSTAGGRARSRGESRDGSRAGSRSGTREGRAVDTRSLRDKIVDLVNARRKACLAICLVLLAIVIVYPVGRGYYCSLRDGERTQAQLAAVEERNAAVEEANEALKTDEGVAAQAREDYGYVENGEQSAVVVNAPDDESSSASLPDQVDIDTIHAPSTWYYAILDIVFLYSEGTSQ